MIEKNVLGNYKHFKGGLYTVIAVGKDSENLSDVVVYKSKKDDGVWVRSYEMFFQDVTVEGKVIPRFQKMD